MAEVAANRRRAMLLCAGPGALVGLVVAVVLALTVSWIAGLVVLVVVPVVAAVVTWRRSTGAALKTLGARPPAAGEEPLLANLVGGLCSTMGLSEPELMVVDDPTPNACAVGRDPADAVLVVTSGLVSSMSLVELEGVMAHELAHVKRHDTALAGAALAVAGPLCRLTGDDRWLHRALGSGREYRADQIAVAATRYPPGLEDALARMEASDGPAGAAGAGSRSPFSGRGWVATRWLWIDPMVGHRHDDTLGNLDATSVRRQALAEW